MNIEKAISDLIDIVNTYDAESVIEDSDFLLFREYLDSDGDLCIIQLVKDELVL